MSPPRLNILYVSQMPPSPPRIGAQARMHGLMTQLAFPSAFSNSDPWPPPEASSG